MPIIEQNLTAPSVEKLGRANLERLDHAWQTQDIGKNRDSEHLSFHREEPLPPANQRQEPVPAKHYHPLRKFIRETMPVFAYSASSVWHVVTAAMMFFGGFSKDTKAKLSQSATAFTKVVNSLVYTDLAFDALEHKFSFDFLGRIAEPIVNLFVDLNHYHLFRAFSSALNQLHITNFSRVKKGTNMWQNFIENLQTAKDIFVETWSTDLTGPNRKLFKGQKDEGHTLAFASHIQLVVGALALLNGNKKNLANRVLGIGRNVAGVLADIGLIWEKDKAAKRTGLWYLAHAVFDTAKRFMSYENQEVVDNLIMPLYNGALYNFGLTTRRQVSGEFTAQSNAAMAV